MMELTQAFDMEYLSGPDREELPKQVKTVQCLVA